MATILKLNLSAARKTAVLPVGHTAEIILFTGVRYERWTEVASVAKPKRKRRSRAKAHAQTAAQPIAL
jgi:hypothetical protein